MVNLFLPYWSCLQFYFSLHWNVLRKESLLLSIFTLGITETLQRPSTVVRALQFVWPSIQFFSFLILFIYPYMLSDSVRWSQLLRGGKSYLFIIFIGCVCCLITHWQIYMWLQKRLWVSVEKRSITNLTAPWGSQEYKEETTSTCPFPLQLWWEFKIGKMSFLLSRCVCVDVGKETWKPWLSYPINTLKKSPMSYTLGNT